MQKNLQNALMLLVVLLMVPAFVLVTGTATGDIPTTQAGFVPEGVQPTPAIATASYKVTSPEGRVYYGDKVSDLRDGGIRLRLYTVREIPFSGGRISAPEDQGEYDFWLSNTNWKVEKGRFEFKY